MSAKIPYYFETEFDYSEPETVTEMIIRHYIDDGAVFYLNGVEVARFNMAAGNVNPTTAASPGVGNATLQTLIISNPNILQGNNRLSVEVHQINTGSSDVVFGVEVSLKQDVPGSNIPYSERDEEWIELHNRSGSSVDLSGWQLSGGISYQFEPGESIPGGGYLVIAKDLPALSAKYSSIYAVGDYSGKLGNSGDLIVLEDSNGNVADEVQYFDSGKWHREADAGGSSLELRDPDADNTNASAWAPSDESARNHWQTYTYEAVAADDGIGLDSYHELQIGMLDAGEFLIDDVSVIENGSLEFIQNGDFDSDVLGSNADKWRAIGTHGSHGRTVVITDPDNPGNQCLHVVSTGPTENKHNKIETTFANSEQVVVGNTYRISFRAKWVSGSSQVNTKLYFNYVQKTHVLESAGIWGTPGAANTAMVSNVGPDLSGLIHSPVVPNANEAVTVSIDATDPDGINNLTLFYKVGGGAYQSVAMTAAGPRFTGTIPGQSASAIVRFYVEGTDHGSAISHYPAAAGEGGAFYKVQDGLADTTGLRHNFRIIIAESDRAFLFLNTNRMSNDRIPATIIENEERVYYDVQLRLKASAHGRYRNANYGFNIRFHPDQLFRGVHPSLSVERGQTTREILSKYLINRAGGGYWSFYDDVAYIIPPTAGHQGVGLLSLSRHTGNYWDSFFPDTEEKGTLFNLELHYAPNGTTGGPEDLKIGNPFNLTKGRYRLEDRGNDKEPYRWGFQIRSARDRDDYSQIIALNQAVGNLSGTALKEALDSIIDVNQWMRTLAMMSLNGTTDTYGRVHEHNFRFFVRPTDGKIIIMQWDLDSAFALATGGPVIPTVNREGAPYPVAKLFAIPEYRRVFDGHLDDLIQTTLNSDYVTQISSGLTAAIGANTNFSTYITNRANYVQSTLPALTPFAITSNGGSNFSEADSVVDLIGTGAYNVFSIEVNGEPVPVTWSGANTWQISVPISYGPNALTITAKNHHGVEVGSDTITVTNTTAPILITEVLTHTDLPEVDSIELYNPHSFPVNVGGWFLTDNSSIPKKYQIPVGTIVPARAYLVFDESDFSVGPDSFRLSEHGEDAYLFSAAFNGDLSGYSHGWKFKAAPNGVTTGHYIDSQGKEHFVLQASNTLGSENSLPLVGPVVVSEIHYHPPDLDGDVDNEADEFIELTNTTNATVPLYSTFTNVPGYGNAALNDTWRLRNAVDFDFPPGVEMKAGERVLVVSFDPAVDTAQLASFRSKFDIPLGIRIFGPWTGKLNNSGEEIEWKYPGSADPDGSFLVPYYSAEEIDYRDA
ncbi:MAG: lamin tail domain-containing protein, partial [Verrucomicrobiales bacterium]|nr:lamin tail domain-containing protein [Verrucomicrobiales bacterium]